MRVTELFTLELGQGSVDFVDVDITCDLPAYIDPAAVRDHAGPFAKESVRCLQTFFAELLRAIRDGDEVRQTALVAPLTEPNETHLGSSKGRSRGRGLGGEQQAQEFLRALAKSKAVQSGFLSDLEDSALLVEGVGKDIVSDIATAVIRENLIRYTQNQCEFHQIPMELQFCGKMWDPDLLDWVEGERYLPRGDGAPLLLVPKAIVRLDLSLDTGKYYRGYLRPYYEQEILNGPTGKLVQVLKNGERRVRLKELDKELGTSKSATVKMTQKHPYALVKYKEGRSIAVAESAENDQLLQMGVTGVESTELRELLETVKAISPGGPGATPYHRSIAAFFSALFSGALGNQRIEVDIHSRLKRIDITYDNVSTAGMFHWLRLNYPSASIVVECKNYSKEIGNPEVDQIAMRLSGQRGRVGFLACRHLDDKERVLDRARAAARDGHGYVLVLDDEDLERLVIDYEAALDDDERRRFDYPLLRERFDRLLC